jgi:hypothetical protein
MNGQTRGWPTRTTEMQKALYYKIRDGGPTVLLKLAALFRDPLETRRRRSLARQYIAQLPFPAVRMDSKKGYGRIEPTYFTNFDHIAAACERLFDIKRAKVEQEVAGMSSWAQRKRDKYQSAKRKFLRNLLSNDDLRRNPELVDFALEDATFGLATQYLGTLPYLNRVDLLYSVPREADDRVASQLFHLDPEGLTQVKFFINVFDIGEAEGPFTFIPADATREILKEIRVLRRTQGKPHVGRYSDEEIAAVGGRDAVIEIKGPRGAGVAIDTSRCLHLGSRVRPGAFRLCMYLQYCTTREATNAFDIKRFKRDPIRYLAVKHSARTAVSAEVTAPHQMES